MTYRKSSKETRGSYSSSEAPTAGLIRILVDFCSFYLLFFKFTAGLIRMRVLFEGGSLSRIYGMSHFSRDFVTEFLKLAIVCLAENWARKRELQR